MLLRRVRGAQRVSAIFESLYHSKSYIYWYPLNLDLFSLQFRRRLSMVETNETDKRDDDQAKDAATEGSCDCSLCANLAQFILGKEIVLKLEVTLSD